MLPEIQTNNGFRFGWRTADILNRTQARLFIGRLTHCGIDHFTSIEGQSIRISVRRSDLQAAMAMRFDSPLGSFPQRQKQNRYDTHLRLLASIPLGLLVGSVLCFWLMIESPLIPTVTCILTCLLAESSGRFLRERRLHSKGGGDIEACSIHWSEKTAC